MYEEWEEFSKCKGLREEIADIFHTQREYDLTILKTNELLQMIREIKILDKIEYNSYMHFCYMILSLAYNNKNDKQKALEYSTKAKEYLNTQDNNEVINFNWQSGMIYKGIDNDKALEYFNKSYDRCAELQMYESMGSLLEEIALIEKDIDKMLIAIDIYASADIKDNYKQTYLDSMRENLINMHIENNDIVSAYIILHKISDKTKQNKTRKKLLSLIKA